MRQALFSQQAPLPLGEVLTDNELDRLCDIAMRSAARGTTSDFEVESAASAAASRVDRSDGIQSCRHLL